MPLIEQIARLRISELPLSLCRYTRFLTALWCVYFLSAIVLILTSAQQLGIFSLAVGIGSVTLFFAEFWLRPHLFKGMTFPNLPDQIRDTWQVWNRK